MVLGADNQASLHDIETSIFIICLDRAVSITHNHHRSIDETDHNLRDDNSLSLQMLHGQGSHLNSCNRWYDKTMQVSSKYSCTLGAIQHMYVRHFGSRLCKNWCKIGIK